ncbi:hypothetical protein [Desulforamulus hydrothermalis]|uniref:hypothetical protein n=1 Tax=Desulforamulus hydrothermalis TaxID=412895 RepID=UPI0002FD302E|nr:hypothetical protein [Desulforamulus hydrothermalis]
MFFPAMPRRPGISGRAAGIQFGDSVLTAGQAGKGLYGGKCRLGIDEQPGMAVREEWMWIFGFIFSLPWASGRCMPWSRGTAKALWGLI